MSNLRTLRLRPLTSILTALVLTVPAAEAGPPPLFSSISADSGDLLTVALGPLTATPPIAIAPLQAGLALADSAPLSASAIIAADPANDRILTIDVSSGSVTSTVALDVDIEDNGLAVSPDGDVLVVTPTLELREVDLLTGVTTLRGTINGPMTIKAIAFDPSRRLYAIGSPNSTSVADSLYVINANTGSATLRGPIAIGDADDLAFGPNSHFYAVRSQPGLPTTLLDIDPTGLDVADLGELPISHGTSLARIPNPSEETLDGWDIPSDFPPDSVLATQVNPTSQSNNLDELDQLFLVPETYGYRIGITGNVVDEQHGLVLLLDTRPGGQATLVTNTVPTPPSAVPQLHGISMDPGFEPDYLLFINHWTASGDPIGNYFVDLHELNSDQTTTKRYIGSGVEGSGFWHLRLGDNPHGMQVAFDNSNTLGVDNVSADNAGSATTGFELFVPYVDVGLDAAPATPIRLSAFVVAWDGYVFAQSLPSFPPGTSNPAFVPAFSEPPGDQFAIVTDPIPTVHVSSGARASGLGDDWASAVTDLQDALNVARRSAEVYSTVDVWVEQGTYTPDRASGLRDVSFYLYDRIRLLGGFAGMETAASQRDPSAHTTILSGDLLGDDGPDFANVTENSFNVVSTIGTSADTVLDGVTIQGGNADGAALIRQRRGAGLFAKDSNATLHNTVLRGGTASVYGGGAYLEQCTSILDSCRFEDNRAARGGGLLMWGGQPFVLDSVFTGNEATVEGGGVRALQSSSPVLINCLIKANSAQFSAAINTLDSEATLVHCQLLQNETELTGTTYFTNSSISLVGCVVAGNHAGWSAGIRFDEGMEGGLDRATVTGCLVYGNVAIHTSGGLLNSGYTTDVSNSIFWANDDADGIDAQITLASDLPGDVQLSHCIVQGGAGSIPGTMVIDEDPLMINPLGPDGVPGTGDEIYRLLPGSPAIDAGTNAAVPPDEYDLNGNLNTTEPLPIDLGGADRFVDDPDTVPDPGEGTPPIVDIGPYEFRICFGDIDGDHDTDVFDFGIFAGNFGNTVMEPGTLGDLDGDGDVDVFDFGLFAPNFGCGL